MYIMYIKRHSVSKIRKQKRSNCSNNDQFALSDHAFPDKNKPFVALF